MGELFGHSRLYDVEMKRVELLDRELPKVLLQCGDLLFARRSLTAEGAGKCSIVKEVLEPTTFESSIIRARPNDQLACSDFLYYLFSSPYGKYLLGTIRRQVAVAGITGTDLKQLKLKVPPLPKQKAIAHILGTLDDKIELNRKMNGTLEAMAQALFKSWFVDFDPVIDNALLAGKPLPEDLEDKAAARQKQLETTYGSLAAAASHFASKPSGFHHLFPDSFELTEELGWIPVGWIISSIGKEYRVVMGQSPKGETYNQDGEGMLFYQGRAEFGWRYPTPRLYTTDPKRIAEAGDVLMSVRAPVGDFNLALDRCCVGRGLCGIRHNSGSTTYSYYQMMDVKTHLEKFNGEGTVFGSINQKDLKALPCLAPSHSAIQGFIDKVECLDSKIKLGCLENIALTKLRDNLLPKLLSGEIRVPEAEAVVEDVG